MPNAAGEPIVCSRACSHGSTGIPDCQPSLTIGKSHSGNFTQGGTGTYTITVGDSGPGSTDGTAVRDTDAATVTGGRKRQVTNIATVSGGGDITTHTATDTATIKDKKHCGKGEEEGKKPGKRHSHWSFYEYRAADRRRS
ncbi:hypothetical protein ACFYZE_25035 [Streptomyces sp. NPDC001796]|uniref:hypothetical protein n=1 Tax=Streptomyces sp. NPDC001796 TaxID=3364609 RepID=UPI00367530BD